MTSQISEQAAEIDELKAVMEGRKQDQKKLAAGMTEIEQLNQTIERYICMCRYLKHIDRYVITVISLDKIYALYLLRLMSMRRAKGTG